MAVVRILRGSSSFSALDYNQERVKRGEAEFLVQRNFPFFPKPTSFDPGMAKQFLSSWSAVNTRAKNTQFHVSISVKGKELNKRELQAVGERWLELMGYADNPYCIFFHRNTRNNHIHIVTTKIDKNGKKINHNFDKIRAVKALDMIMGTDKTKELRNSVADYLRFSYANNNQFFAILENNGFVVRKSVSNNEEYKYNIYKGGNWVCELNDSLLQWTSRRYNRPLLDSRRIQIKALLIKYANKVNTFQGMSELLRKHHGLSLVMFGGTNGKPYYGFAVIDYKNKSIHKGSEFASVEFLSKILEQKPITLKEANLMIFSLLESCPYSTIQDINKSTRKYGFYISKEGLIVSSSSIVIGNLNPDLQKQLNYNYILKSCNDKYRPITKGERAWIASHYHLAADDLKVFEQENLSFRRDSSQYYEDTFKSMLEEGDFQEQLHESHLSYTYVEGEFIFFDGNQSAIFSTDTLEPDIAQSVEEAISSQLNYPGYNDSGYSDDVNVAAKAQTIDSALRNLLPGSGGVSGGGSGSDDDKKKKRKKRRF